MPVFHLGRKLSFPHPELAVEDGLLAIGGDLSPQRLLLAYKRGIFPWYNDEEPILWWSPDPRFVLYPSDLKISKSMRQVLRKKKFRVTFDQNFEDVIKGCSQPRDYAEGTWITADMIDAYTSLHELGYAHSVEVWEHDLLVGGLYGLSMGSCFFGESMFTKVSNASKAGFIKLVRFLEKNAYSFIDCQMETSHLESLGAQPIPRKRFLKELQEGLSLKGLPGKWSALSSDTPIV